MTRNFNRYLRNIMVICATACVCSLVPGPSVNAAASAAVEDGWRMLWHDQNTQARAVFQSALRKNPADTEALRGLGRLALEEDDVVGALSSWRLVYKYAPGTWTAAMLWPEMVKRADDTGRYELLEASAKDIVSCKSAQPSIQASARLVLANAALRAGNIVEAKRIWSGLGYIRAWNVIGPFDNISRSGFDKPFPPEQSLAFKPHCVGKDNQDIEWRRLSLIAGNGECRIASSLGDHDPDVYYAATALYSAKEQTVAVQMSTVGVSKLFVNQELVFSDAVYRTPQFYAADTFQVTVALHAGWNTFLLKLGDDKYLSSAFSIRLTTPDGHDMPALRADPAQSSAAAVRVAAAPATNQPTFVAYIRKSGKSNPEASNAVIEWLRDSGDYAASTDAARAALAQLPGSGCLHWQLSQSLQSDKQVDDARAEREIAANANNRLVDAQLAYITDKMDAMQPGELLRRLKSLLPVNPHSVDILWTLADAYSRAKLVDEAIKAARAAEKSMPSPDQVQQLVAFLEDHDRSADAHKVLKDGLLAYPNSTALLEKDADSRKEQGDANGAIADYKHLLLLDDANVTYRASLASACLDDQHSALAVKELRTLRVLRPQDGTACSILADAIRDKGGKQEALALLKTAIQLDPENVALREERQVLSGEKPVTDLAPATPSGPLLAKAKTLASGGESAIMLLDEDRQVVYPDYATLSHCHEIVKVFDAAGVARFTQFPIPHPTSSASVNVESARLIKADGTIQDLSDSSDTEISFPSLAAGDVIDVAYRIQDYPKGGLAHQFWDEWFFDNSASSVLLSRYVLITPITLPFQIQPHGAAPEPAVRDVSTWRIRDWSMKDIPSLKPEVLGPGRIDDGVWLDFSSIKSWTDIVSWYRDVSGPRCIPDDAIRAKAGELTKDLKTEKEKLRAIIKFVCGIQYQSTPFRLSAYTPTEGKQVLRERYGDCKDKAALLTALLAAVGIKSDMVLLSGRDHGITPYLPSPRFNHAIARVQTADGPLWVDGTADDMAFADFPYDDQQVPALVIDPATTDLTLTPLLPPDHSSINIRYEGVLGADGTLHANLKLSSEGNMGWLLRSSLKRVPENNRDQALRGFAAAIAKNSTYESGGMENVSDPEKPFTMAVKYHVDNYAVPAGSFLLVNMPWEANLGSDRLGLLETGGKRLQSMEIASSRMQMINSIRLEMPPGYVLQDPVPEVHGDSPFASFRIAYHTDGNVLTGEFETTTKSMRITAADFPEYLAFLHLVKKEGTRQLVFKKQ